MAKFYVAHGSGCLVFEGRTMKEARDKAFAYLGLPANGMPVERRQRGW